MRELSKQFYVWTRDLHLYFGLFLSPFVVVFAVSTLLLNHAWDPRDPESETVQVTSAQATIPDGLTTTRGMEQVALARQVLDRLSISGEIERVALPPEQNRLVIAVVKPGERITVEVDLGSRAATIERRRTGFWDALNYLHKSPGPHAPAIRGNWFHTRLWRSMADAVVCILIFISISGIYLWAVLKAERKTGLILIGAGAVSFIGIVWGLTA